MSQFDTNIEETNMMDSDVSSFIEDRTNDYDDPKVGTIVALVENKFSKAEDGRYADEQRWIRAYRNYRGIYDSDVQFTNTEKSRIFVKVTKTKVLAAYGQIVDVLFGNNRFPITIDPTILPEGVSEAVSFDPTKPDEMYRQQGAMTVTPEETLPLPGETLPEYRLRLGALETKLAPIMDKLEDGHGTTPSSITFFPALVAAKKMEKKIHDQLEESNASKHLRNAAFECALFGTGIMKGPFARDKE